MQYRAEHEGKQFTPDGAAQAVPDVDAANRETSQREVAAFAARTADGWFGYIDEGPKAYPTDVGCRRVTTWMGDTLATVEWFGHVYKCPAFGRCSRRLNFRARGIDGRTWAGTYYLSSGNYCRMRVVNNRPTPCLGVWATREETMGNRAVIAYESMPTVGIYLHWNGGPESVLAFLEATRARGVRSPGGSPEYSLARLVQTIGDFFASGDRPDYALSLGVGPLAELDTRNGDNGVYWVGDDWEITRREHHRPYGDGNVLRADQLDPKARERYATIVQTLNVRAGLPARAAS